MNLKRNEMNITLMILTVLAVLGVLFYLQVRKIKRMPEASPSAKVLNLTAQNFGKEIQTGVTLVDFWASWCMPCKMMAPILNEVAEETDGKARVAKLNIEQHQRIANQYKVKSIPTMILFRNGKEIDRIIGVKTKDVLVNKIERLKYL